MKVLAGMSATEMNEVSCVAHFWPVKRFSAKVLITKTLVHI